MITASTQRSQVLSWLTDNVSAHRLQHILGVEEFCMKLAKHYQIDPEKAANAGLYHDLAKFFPPDKLLRMAEIEGITIDPVLATNPHLLHADVSAIVARDQFGVADSEILEAVRNHTLGRPRMSRLSCIVFIADVLELNRGDSPQLALMRQTAWDNLHRCVLQTTDYSLQYLIKTSRTIHPRTILTRNWALQLSKQLS